MDNILISFVVIIHNMKRQAMNTLYSLSKNYQKNIEKINYEVIVIENNSQNNLDSEEVAALGNEFIYQLHHSDSKSPAHAINIGIQKCHGSHICLMIDGARMLTPRVIEYIAMACKADRNALIAVPGYSLGWQDQHLNTDQVYNEEVETDLLEKINWKTNGYRLFDIAVLSGANSNGYFNPFMECNCITASRTHYDAIGGADESFQLPGGGSLNLHMFRQLGLQTKPHKYFVIAGEGSFHQYHGGVTTTPWNDLEEVLSSHRQQLHQKWPNGFSSLIREPTILGSITSNSIEFSKYSNLKSIKRSSRHKKQEKPLWIDDLT